MIRLQEKLFSQFKKNSLIELIIYSVIIFFSFVLPIFKPPIPFIITILLILSIVRVIIHKGRNIQKPGIATISIFILYLFYIAGLIYTSDMKRGIFDLEVKLGFIVFPVIFIFMGGNILDIKRINTIKFSFVAGTVAGTLICLFNALYVSLKGYFTFDNFMYSRLSVGFHPSYFAMFLNLSIVILFIHFIKYWTQIKLLKKILICFLILYLFVFVIFINSKAGLIISSMTIFLLLVYLVVIKRKILSGLLILGVFIAMFAFVMIKTPYMTNRFNSFMGIVSPDNHRTIRSGDGTSNRILIWKYSLNVIADNLPFGVGTGDVRYSLNQCYIKNSFIEGTDLNLNSHNQFLQTSVAIGLPGLIILLFILILLFIRGIQRRELFSIFLFIIIFGNFLVESMLETQAGVVFTIFFIILSDFEIGIYPKRKLAGSKSLKFTE